MAMNPANSCVYKIKKNSIKNVLPFFFQSLQSSSIPHTAFVHRGRQNPENTSCHIAALKQHYATFLSLNNSFKIILLVQCLVTRPPLSLWQVPNYTKWQFLQNAALKLKAYLEPWTPTIIAAFCIHYFISTLSLYIISTDRENPTTGDSQVFVISLETGK